MAEQILLSRVDLGGVAAFSDRNSLKLFFKFLKIPKKIFPKKGTLVFLSADGGHAEDII